MNKQRYKHRMIVICTRHPSKLYHKCQHHIWLIKIPKQFSYPPLFSHWPDWYLPTDRAVLRSPVGMFPQTSRPQAHPSSAIGCRSLSSACWSYSWWTCAQSGYWTSTHLLLKNWQSSTDMKILKKYTFRLKFVLLFLLFLNFFWIFCEPSTANYIFFFNVTISISVLEKLK